MTKQEIEITSEELVNEDGHGYGWDVIVKSNGHSVQECIEALCGEFGLNPNNEKDMEYIHNYGSGVWNQLNWRIIE